MKKLIAQKYNVKVLVDEIFHDFVEEKQPSAATLDDHFISLTRKLAGQYQLYVAPGHFFGLPEHIRIGFGGASEELEIGLKLLANAIRDHEFSDEI